MMLVSLPAFVFGGLSVLGWSPFEYWWMALSGYGVLFHLLSGRSSAWQSAVVGFAYGLGLNLVGHGWAMDALHGKVGMGLFPAILGTSVFIIYVALFTSIPCWLWHVLIKRNGFTGKHLPVAAFAALLTLGEWARSLFFDGFTSLSLGYSLVDTWLAGYAPILGLYGLSWLGYYLSGIVALTLRERANWLKTAIAVGLIGAVGFGLHGVDWVTPSGTPLSYRLLQTNVPQERKFDPFFMRQQEQRFVEAIERQRADLVITPETVFTVYLSDLSSDILSRLQQFSRRTDSHLFIGIPTFNARGEGHNSLIHVAPGKSEIGQYDKVSLMPFGEYSPAGFGWFTRSIHIRLKDLSPGKSGQQPFMVNKQRISALICHEEEVRRWPDVPNVVINPSNLAWFEGSLAIDQRLQMVRMRGLEYGRPVLRATNTGITAHIDHRGAVLKRLPKAEEDALTGQVQPMEGKTPYALWGDWPVVSGGALLLVFAWSFNWSRYRVTKRS